MDGSPERQDQECVNILLIFRQLKELTLCSFNLKHNTILTRFYNRYICNMITESLCKMMGKKSVHLESDSFSVVYELISHIGGSGFVFLS